MIAQISDFHLKPPGVLAYGVADTAAALRRAVDHLNGLVPRPHAVLVTGDLVDEGASESYRVLREILIGLRMPFFMVPGNHDHKDHLRRAFPEHPYLAGVAEPDGRRALCCCIEEFPLRLIGLDTVIPGEHGGGLNPGRLAWLDRVLSERPAAPALIFMHHPPFASGIGHMDGERFIRRDELAATHPAAPAGGAHHLRPHPPRHQPAVRRDGRHGVPGHRHAAGPRPAAGGPVRLRHGAGRVPDAHAHGSLGGPDAAHPCRDDSGPAGAVRRAASVLRRRVAGLAGR
ncbi:MAG: metallophosphoesterase [Desulfosudis oleivorans]|nr:metallophosphoesterase [Desulfosudis oleivorans]